MPDQPKNVAPEAALTEPVLRTLERIAVDLAHGAAVLIDTERPEQVRSATKSSATDPVTEMDTRAEAWLRERLATLRPHDAVVGEEDSVRLGTTGITWVIDPIDGTTNYLYRLPAYAVSVAAALGSPLAGPGQWRPVAGAVCAPSLRTIWGARAGGGAWRADLNPLTAAPADAGADRGAVVVSPVAELRRALVGTGFSYQAPIRAEQAAVLGRLLPAVRDLRRLGSAAIDLCLVADGRLDAYYEACLNPWDLAAGWLIATEAGALVTGADGGAPDVRLTVAANPPLHPQLLSVVAH